MKRLITAIALAMAIFMVPVAGVLAAGDTSILKGGANVTVTDPIVITCTGGEGSYVDGQWAVSVVSGSTVQLKLTATNKSTSDYRVYATVTPTDPIVSGVTAAWNSINQVIPSNESFEFILTVTAAKSVVTPCVANFTFEFTR